MEFTDNPVADAERYMAEQERELQKLPKCSECGEPIMDDYFYKIGEELYCQDCMDNRFVVWTEDYMNQ